MQVSLNLGILMRVAFLSAPALSFRAQLWVPVTEEGASVRVKSWFIEIGSFKGSKGMLEKGLCIEYQEIVLFQEPGGFWDLAINLD